MKDKVILLIDSDADCGGTVLEAAARTAHGVRLSRDSAGAFGFLSHEFDRIDTIIVDLDPGSRGLALLDAISALHCRPPIIVLTAVEESQRKALAARYGVAACLGKPLSVDRLEAAIELISGRDTGQEISSDSWGHPRDQREEIENGAHA